MTSYPARVGEAGDRGIRNGVVPAGGGGAFGVKIDEPGIDPLVSHSFASVMLGEAGLLKVGDVAGRMSH